MRFRWSDEKEMLRRAVRSFADKELAPASLRQLDAQGRAPGRELLPKMAALGFTALPVPPEYGGLGGGVVDAAIMFEELGRNSLAATSVLAGAIGIGCQAVKHLGSAAQKRGLLEKLVRGDLCFAHTIAGPGGDPDAAPVTAREQIGSHGYILEGKAVIVTGAPDADCLIVAAAGEDLTRSLSLFAVDPQAAGIARRHLETSGLRGAGAFHVLDFNAVHVADDALLGAPGSAADAVLAALMHLRILEAAACTGCAQQAVDDAVRYAGEREQFGQPIAKFQAISHLLVDLQVEVDAARTLVYRAAWAADAGRDFAREAAMAHLAASETLLRTSSDAMRVYGGYGLTMEFDIQRHFRDARLFVVGDGANRSQRDLVARSMGLAA